MRPCGKFFIALAILLFGTACGFAQPTSSPATTQSSDQISFVYTLGNQKHYWLARVEPSPDETGAVRTTIQSRGEFSDRWQVISQLDSCVVGLANKGIDTLAVLLQTGQWMLVWDDGGALGPELPPGVMPIAMAGDGSRFFAVARGALPPVDVATQPTTQAVEPLIDRSKIGLGVFELVGEQQWKLRAIIPEKPNAIAAIELKPDDVSLSTSAGKLLIALHDGPSHLRLLQFSDTRVLSEIGELNVKVVNSDFAMLGDGMPRPAVWTGDGTPAGSLHFLDSLQSAPKPLAPPNELKPDEGRTIAFAVGGLRLLFGHGDNFAEQVYSTAGDAQAGILTVARATPSTPGFLYEWLTLPLILVITFFLINPVRGRDAEPRQLARRANGTSAVALAQREELSNSGHTAPPADVVKKDFVIIAPINLRFWAGVLDALPILLVAFFAVAQLTQQSEDAQLTLRSWELLSLGALSLHFLHTVISELIGGRTFGKWIFGLRTVDMNGERPHAVAVIVRNIVRIPELLLGCLPMLAIFFTRHRQRLGDLAANTVVVLNDASNEEDVNNDSPSGS